MKTSKRLLALASTLLMLVTCFALPYGALAEENAPIADTQAEADAIGKLVGSWGETAKTNTKHAGDVHTIVTHTTSAIALDATKTYVVAVDVMVTSTHANSTANTEWMKYFQDGNIQIQVDGAWSTLKQSSAYGIIPLSLQEKAAAGEYVTVMYAVPAGATSVTGVQMQEYTHFDRIYKTGIVSEMDEVVEQYAADAQISNADANADPDLAARRDAAKAALKEAAKAFNITLGLKNCRVYDVTRNANGGLNETIVQFGQPGVEYITENAEGAHTVACMPSDLNAIYNLASGMTIGDLTTTSADFRVEFEVKFGGKADPSKIVNGGVSLIAGNTGYNGGNWTNNPTINEKDVWKKISIPLTKQDYANITDVGAITRIYASNFNDETVDGTQVNYQFTSTVRNARIVHVSTADLTNAIEDSKYYVYDVDDNATAYETALENARTLFTSEDATYSQAVEQLAAVNTALANLTNAVYHGNKVMATLSAMPQDWRNLDGVTNNSTGITLAGDLGDYALEFTMTSLNEQTIRELYPSKLHFIELRNNQGGENVVGWNVDFSQIEGADTTSCKISIPLTPVTTSGVEVAPGITLNRCNLSSGGAADPYNFTKETILTYIVQARMPSHSSDRTKAAFTDMQIVNYYTDKLDEIIKECATASIKPGKYTAESVADYKALQETAQNMVGNADVSLQQKSQLAAQIDAAKAKFEYAVPEYLQFGESEVESTVVNTGVNGKHSFTHKAAVFANKITENTDVSNLKLRIEVFITRDDGLTDASVTMVNGAVTLKGATSDIKKNGGISKSGMLTNRWETIYLNMSDFSNVSAAELMKVTNMEIFEYNDLRHTSSSPGITIRFRNIAIVDDTNAARMVDLAAAFEDVTKGGTVDFTPDSLAQYQKVYDEWYPVYKFVDLAQADAAIAAMTEAYSLLHCVDKTVMTFNGKIGETGNGGDTFYSNWTTSDQGMVDISIRDLTNLRMRVKFTFKKLNPDAADLPETVTVTNARLSVRRNDGGSDPAGQGKERSYNAEGASRVTTSVTTTGTNFVDIDMSDTSRVNCDNLDGLLKDMIFYISLDGLSEAADNDYAMVIEEACVADITKDLMAEKLEADATITLNGLGAADGVVYDDASATEWEAAQDAAQEVLTKENPTYAELDEAQKAIDTAKNTLSLIGHTVSTVKSLTGVNSWMYNNKQQFYLPWSGFDNKPVDLTKYNMDNLVFRMDVEFGLNPDYVEDGWTPDVQPETLQIQNLGFPICSRVNGAEKGANLANANCTIPSTGVTTLEFNMSDFDFTTETDWSAIDSIRWFFKITNLVDTSTNPAKIDDKNQDQKGPYRFNIYNARIVDITAEKNIGKVTEVGNGAIDITGGLKYGTENTLTATTSSSTAKFVGWKVNDKFIAAVNGEANTQTLKATGSQNVTAYFVESDETAVIYYGKYNRVLDVQVVKEAADLKDVKAPAINGQQWNGWNEDDISLAEAIQKNLGGTTAVTAVYETVKPAEGEGFTLTVVDGTVMNALDATNENGVYSGLGFDVGVKVKANVASEGQAFSHWTINNAVASYAEELTFYISGDVTVKAVYVAAGTEVKQELSANITQNTMVAVDSTFTYEIIGQTYLPSDYELMDYGVVFAPNGDVLNDMVAGASYDEAMTKKVVSSSRVANRQYQINMTGIKSGRTRYAVAYITAVDAAGNVVTVYSNVVSQTAA